ncbi:hypothetical protein FHY55_08470 [Oceanicola sp. D3]|uniref:hypothetical protein n=1 Tax=Oceanicola sp. D3 TaxID=2587163 RepID=UPI00112340C1|nr:hypothetical protein [Oceanicola sp. D3]QDC09272.1 hypothetical protein FHY55_08470 [Oceanicola sp. D3]
MTFTKTSILALAAAAITAPAFADNASLSGSVGVEPGVYSIEQLIQLKGLDEGDNAQRQYILDNPEGASAGVSSKSVVGGGAGADKLAASVGVEPGLYSVDQLIGLAALDDGDNAQRQYILENPEGASAGLSSKSVVEGSAAASKLAASVGVEPGLYSVDQLIGLAALDDGDQAQRAYILNNPAFGS